MESNDAEERGFTRITFCGASYLFCTIHSKLSLLMGRWQHCICTKMQRRGEFSQYFVCATVATEYQSVDGNADKQRFFFFDVFSIGECFLSILISLQVPITRKLCQTFILFPENRENML